MRDLNAFLSPDHLLMPVEKSAVVGVIWNRSVTLPAGVACHVGNPQDASGRWVHDGVLTTDDDGPTWYLARIDGRVLNLALDGMVCGDGGDLAVSLALVVAVDTTTGSIGLILREFAAGSILATDLAQHLTKPVRQALTRVVGEHSVSVWLSADRQVHAAAEREIRGELFRRGLRLGSLTFGEVHSRLGAERQAAKRLEETNALRQQLARQLHQQAVEQRTAELESATATLQALRSTVEKNPGLSLTSLMVQFSAEVRGALYEAMLRDASGAVVGVRSTGSSPNESATAERAMGQARLLVVTASGLMDVAADGASRLVEGVNDDLGLLRSVSANSHGLAVGAQSGLWLLDRQLKVRSVFQVPTSAMVGQPAGGFNSAALVGQFVLATHSELGAWLFGGSEPVPLAVRGRRVHGCRALADGRLVFACDSMLMCVDPLRTAERVSMLATLPTEIQSVAVAGGGLFAGLRSGQLVRVSLAGVDGRLAEASAVDTLSGPIQAMSEAVLGGVSRLLICDGSQRVVARVVEDTHSTDYVAPTGMRLAVSDQVSVFAVDDLRHRLWRWPVSDPRGGRCVLNVQAAQGRSIQDMAIWL